MRKVPFDSNHLVHFLISHHSEDFFFFLNKPSVNEGKYCFHIYGTYSLRH